MNKRIFTTLSLDARYLLLRTATYHYELFLTDFYVVKIHTVTVGQITVLILGIISLGVHLAALYGLYKVRVCISTLHIVDLSQFSNYFRRRIMKYF
jgi:hypothetical protein